MKTVLVLLLGLGCASSQPLPFHGAAPCAELQGNPDLRIVEIRYQDRGQTRQHWHDLRQPLPKLPRPYGYRCVQTELDGFLNRGDEIRAVAFTPWEVVR